ncbi:MAG: hypothetical protein ABJE95_06570 [Byssovorax sp.]
MDQQADSTKRATARRARSAIALVLGAGLLGGCSTPPPTCAADCAPLGTTVAMDFTRKSGFYGAPFPGDFRLATDGHVDLADFPVAGATDLVKRILAILRADARGFSTTSGIFFQLTASLQATDLPSVADSVTDASPVVLLGVDPAAPDHLVRYPIATAFLADAGPYGAPNLLVALPLQGVPLRPHTRYAAIVRRSLHDAKGALLDRSPSMAALASGGRPEGMSDAVLASTLAALDTAAKAGIPRDDIAGITIFTTGSPTDSFAQVTAAMLAAPAPAPTKPFVRNEIFTDYCVYETTIPMPEYQGGAPPYQEEGGGWVFDDKGAPVLQRMEEARFVITVPRRTMPPKGFPLVVFSRTGGGGERPLVDRGVQAMTGGPALTPGTGPALIFAGAGFAGSSIDGPHGGLRNVTHGDEQFLIFNVGNPVALRDNIRQSAAELALQAHVLDAVSIDVADCPGVVTPDGKARFDTATLALMGHSMGATIAPLTLAYEPRYRAGLLSGAGGSWIENVIYKQEPVALKGLAGILIGIGSDYALTEYDPVLSLFQWAAEPSDPPVYARRIVQSPEDGPSRHVLMMQGIVDNYILPPIANATSLSIGLDLAGDELDAKSPALAGMAPIGSLLPLVGRGPVALPVAGNVTGKGGAKVTAVVTQYPEDGIENGHEVVFQTEAPKHAYGCFLQSFAKGAPRVPEPGKVADPCE